MKATYSATRNQAGVTRLAHRGAAPKIGIAWRAGLRLLLVIIRDSHLKFTV